MSVRYHVAQRHLTLTPPPPVDLREWESDDDVNATYVKKLVALATTMHINHRTIGTMIYLGFIANEYYGSAESEKAIRFRKHLDQEYHATAAACMLLETLDNSMIPGSVAGTAIYCVHRPPLPLPTLSVRSCFTRQPNLGRLI